MYDAHFPFMGHRLLVLAIPHTVPVDPPSENSFGCKILRSSAALSFHANACTSHFNTQILAKIVKSK